MLILASQSAARNAMLRAAGLFFETVTAQVDETALKAGLVAQGKGARLIARALATAKAHAVADHAPGAFVLGGDQIVSVGGTLYDKPDSRAEAAKHLRVFSGQMMTLYSAAVLVRNGELLGFRSDEAHLKLRALSPAFIADYLDQEWPAVSGCVGCFRIEGRGITLFEAIDGSHFTILGMPLLGVLEMLRAQGLVPA